MSSATSSSVCQGLQSSCLEPILREPRVLMHQLAPPKPGLSPPTPQDQTETNSIQSLITNTCRKLSDEAEQVYVHPLVKRSAAYLSTRSLEMCTESLGSETGNGIDLCTTHEFPNHAMEWKTSSINKQPKFCHKVRHSSFPPPLSSISGGGGIGMQTHREGGRLVIKAFNFPSCSTYFQAERENGRLRLSLLKDGSRGSEHELVEDEEAQDEGENVIDEAGKICGESEDDGDELDGIFWGENLKEDGGKVGCKKGGGEWSSSSRCNGNGSGSKRLPSLPFCVAIS